MLCTSPPEFFLLLSISCVLGFKKSGIAKQSTRKRVDHEIDRNFEEEVRLQICAYTFLLYFFLQDILIK